MHLTVYYCLLIFFSRLALHPGVVLIMLIADQMLIIDEIMLEGYVNKKFSAVINY